MTVLEQIRAENPNLALIPDDELLQKLLLEYQGDLDPDVYMQSLTSEQPVVSPVVSPVESLVLGGKRALAPTSNVNDIGFGQALTGPARSSWARSWGPSITRLKGGIAALSGNEDRAQQLYSQAQQEDRGILQNSGYVSFAQATEGPDAGVDTFVKAGLSAIGSSSPFLVEGIAGAVTGAKIGRFAGPVGAAIGAGVGAAVASFPRLFEFNLSRQQEQVSIGNLDSINEGRAALTALPQAALESVMFPVVGKLFGKVGRTEFSNIINRATTGRVAKGTALGVTGEAATEVGQQVLERYQAGLPIDTPEAIAEYKEAAFAGGFVGGAFGGAATLAGEATRAVQPTPTPVEKPVETPVQKPLEAPVVKGGIIQPQQQKDIAKQQAVEEQAKPVNFAVEQQADKFVVKEQSLDANNNIVKTTPLNVFNTQEEAIANQKESQEQKNKVSEQTFFTADEIKTENPTLGNIIDEVELLGNKIAPNVKQVYFQKDLALAKGNESAVKASGGTLGSSVDGWYDRTSDINFISTSNLDNIQETVAHENFHALQRVQNRASGLFTEQEQSALNTFLPGGTIDNINPLVQKALGNDVMTRLRERHLGSEVTPQEMQAYAFGAYTSMKAKGARLAAPNPVIRAFKKFFDFLKGVGNIFRKNKINNVQDLFEQARTGKIGKRAVSKEGIDELRTTSIQKAERAAAKGVTPSTTPTDAKQFSLSKIELNEQETKYLDELVNQRFDGGTLIDDYTPSIKVRGNTLTINKNEIGKLDEYLDEFNDLERKSRGGEGMLTIPFKLRKVEYGKKRLYKIANDLDKAETISEYDADEGKQEFALSTVKIREKAPEKKLQKITEAGKFFDDMVEETDIMDDKAFKKAINETAKEVEFQKGRVLNGLGWYSKDATTTFKLLEKVYPNINKGANDQDMFTAFTAVLSPNRDPQQNVVLAARVYDYYKKHGSIPIHNPATKKYWTLPNSAKQLSLLQYLLDKYGENGTVEFLRSKKTIRQMAQEQRDAGANGYNDVSIGMKYKSKDPVTKVVTTKTTTKELANYKPTSGPKLGTGKKLDDEFLGSMIFGPKVGRFFLDIRNIKTEEADGVTKDIWFSRSFYRQFGQLTDNTPSSRDGLKGTILKKHEQRADEFAVLLAKKTNLSPNDAQAALWYYEHELYADILKNPSKVRLFALSDGAKKFIKELNDGKYKEIESGQPSRSVEVRKRIKAREDKTTGEVDLSVSQREEVKEDLELSVSPDTAIKDTDVKAFLKSGTDVTSYNPEEYFAAAETRGPLVGHCAACAYVIQKNYGGDVMQVFVPPKKGFNKQREKHYFNKLPDGTFIDLTGEQYGNQSVTPPQDFIGRAKIGPHQWGDSARYKGKLNKRFTDFEEKFNSIKEQDVENTSKNLDDILPPEFSISEDKELLNPPGTDVSANIDVDELAIFEDLLGNGKRYFVSNLTIRKQGYAAVRRFVNERYAEQIKKFGKPVNIPDTNMSPFLFNIYVESSPVGKGYGVRLGDTAFIDLVELNESETKYLSPSAFRKIGVDLSKRLGVKKFAGQRTTGARLKVDAERIEKGLDIVNTRQDNIATSEEFNQEAFDEANNIELSVSNDMLTDKEIQNSALPSNVKNKLFLNRDLEDGTKISVRPNLNGKVIKGEDKLFVQTIHPGKNLSKALGYDGAVRVTDPSLNVNQKKRADIALGRENKNPMAAVYGKLSKKEATLEGQVLDFNPKKHHLFVDSDGFAVKSIQGEAVMYNTKIYTTGNLEYYTEENAPKPLEDINSEVKFKSSEEAETASQNLDDILSPKFSISENKNRLDKPGSTIEVDNDPIDALNNYGLGAVFDSSTRLDIPLSDADISKEIAESVQRVKDGKSSYSYGSDKDLLEKYGDPVNVRGSKIPLFSVGFTIDNEIVGSAQGIKLGKTAIIDFVQLQDSENNYISPTGFRTIGFKIAQELGVNKFAGQRVTGSKRKSRIDRGVEEAVAVPTTESSEFNTLSQEERIESNLEFSVTDDIVSDAHQSARNKINPKFARTTPVGYWKQYTDNVGIKLQQGIIDQYASIKKYLGDEPYKAATMTYASGGATEGALLYGVPFLDNDGAIDIKEDTLGTGLFTRLEKLGNKLPIFLEYVAGKRAEFLESEGKETGFSPGEIQTLISLRNGNEKLFDEGLADLNEFNKAFLDMGLKSGYLSQEAYDTWTGGGGYDFYLPFYRVLQEIGETEGPSAAPSIVNQPEIKKLVGSSRPIQDLLSNIVRNYNFLTEATLKNIAALKALEAGVEQGVTREVPFNERSKDAVFVRRNGERVFFEVDEPVVLQALQAMNWGGWQNPAMGALRNFKRYLTLGVTFSPAFRIRNLIRDTIHSIAVGPLTYNPLENVLQGYKTLRKDKKTGLSEMRAKMAFGGGEIHFGHIYGNDPNATKMLLDRAIDVNTVMKSDGWSSGSLKLMTGQLKKALRSWNETGSFAENINRAALYKQLRDKGVSHFEASYQARDLLNFSRHGANPFVRFLTQSVPFLNARIQGLDKMGRAMGPEQRTQLITTLGAYSLASIGLYMMFKDDEDFKQREQWDRDTYHWFKFPGSEIAFRIPKPFEVGAIGTIAERLVEQIVDDDVHGSLFVERLMHMTGETFAFDYKPQLITPALEVYANKNEFTERPIVTDWMKRLPASERKYAWTKSAYTFSSKLLNTISFDQIQISPVQIEHLVEGYFGFIGSSIAATVSIVDYPRNLAKITSKDSPLFMGFVKALPSRQSKYKTEFYELLSKMNETNSLYRSFMRVGNTEDALKVYNKNKNIFAWRGAYTKVNKQLQQISNQIRIVENNKNLSEKEKLDKVRQLNILKNNIIQMIRQQTLDFEKNTGTRVKRPIFWK